MLRPPSTMAGDGMASSGVALSLATQLATQLGGVAADYLSNSTGIWRVRLHADYAAIDAQDCNSDATHTLSDGSEIITVDSANASTLATDGSTGLQIVCSGVTRVSVDLDALSLNLRQRLRLVWIIKATSIDDGCRLLMQIVDSTTGTYTRALQVGVKRSGANYIGRWQVYNGGWTQGDGATITALGAQTYRVELDFSRWHAEGRAEVGAALADNPEDVALVQRMNIPQATNDAAETDPWTSVRMARLDVVPTASADVLLTDFYVLEAV